MATIAHHIDAIKWPLDRFNTAMMKDNMNIIHREQEYAEIELDHFFSKLQYPSGNLCPSFVIPNTI